MEKKLTPKPKDQAVKPLLGTQYVLLPDGQVARLLKSMVAHDKLYYNLIIDNDYHRLNMDKINVLTDKHYSEVLPKLKK